MNQRYDLLIFDWDGTLFDSIGWIVDCLRHAADCCGLEIPSEHQARSVIGLSLQQAMQQLYPGSSEAQAQALARHYRTFYHTQSSDLGVFAQVPEVLSTLREQGYQLAVATGKARSGLDPALAQTRLDGLFHATRCACETASKPDPRMVFEILDELGMAAERTLLIGDSLHDLRMGHRAGVDVLAVTCGANTHAELAELHPQAIIEHPVDLLPLLTRGV